jgi:hypothetical protein
MGLWTWHRAGVAAKHSKQANRRLRRIERRPVPVRTIVRVQVLALPPRPDLPEPGDPGPIRS